MREKNKDKAILKYVRREIWIFIEKYGNQSIEVYGDTFLYLDSSFSVFLFFPNKQTNKQKTGKKNNKNKEKGSKNIA